VPAVAFGPGIAEPVHLRLPGYLNPYASTRVAPRRLAVGPALLLLGAITLALGWDPMARRLTAARALGGESSAALDARRQELGHAVRRLQRLAADAPAADPAAWRVEVQEAGRLWRLTGDSRSPSLGELEVRARAAWLALASLPPSPSAAALTHTREELSELLEDLEDAP
jgi:hypothetical protein